MAALTHRDTDHKDRSTGVLWIGAAVALVLLSLAWVLDNEWRQSATDPGLALPITRELPAMPNPEPMPLPAPRPLG